MEKIEKINDNTGITANSKQIEILKKHFPNCFDKHGAFVPHKMAEIVGKSELELSRESYSLNWLGKSYARLLANENPLTLLAENKEHNQKEENKNSQNILIKGDNLEVLKHLKNAYSEKIKMIYIDPPYNTGGDGFVYEDDRKFTIDELSKLAGIELEEAKRILEFTKSKANSHSAWLTFMYPRLYVARELLKDDGVIFISIDDNEAAQLKMLCDEVFGEENFVANIVWQKRTAPDMRTTFSDAHEYILLYCKTLKGALSIKQLALTDEQKEKYKNPDNDPRGSWVSSDFTARGVRPNQLYGIKTPSGKVFYPPNGKCWQNLEDVFLRQLEEGRFYFGANGDSMPRRKNYLSETDGKIPWTWWSNQEVGHSQEGKMEVNQIFDTPEVFSTPKPVRLIQRMVQLATESDSLVLDFFAGSGTTAHAVMELNTSDDGNRKFITVQIPQETDTKSEAHKAGYKTIFDITKARIEKAADAIKDKKPDYDGDLGFRIFETVPVFDGYLDDIEELEEGQTLFDGSMLDDTQLGYLLTTWKVYDGIELTTDLSVAKLCNYEAYYHDKILYFMGKGFDAEALKAFVAKLDEDKVFNPSKVVVFGYNFTSKHQRELKEALAVYKNKKAIELDVVVRY